MMFMKCCCNLPLKEEMIQKSAVMICPKCGLITKKNQISFEEEKKRYDTHICDDGYLSYMHSVYEKIKKYITGNIVLDFGCGKIPALAAILKKEGFMAEYYDLHYYPILPNKVYDTIVLIEVFEHLSDPYQELLKLQEMLSSKGRIILMTKPYDDVDLQSWWYFRDQTHISFIRKDTLSLWDLKMKIIQIEGDIFVLERI